MANPYMSGGDRVCAIYAQKLADLGHTVNIIAPKKRFVGIKTQVKRLLKGQSWLSKAEQKQNHFYLLGLEVIYADKYSPIENTFVPDADVVIATWWETAEWVFDFSKEKGKKVYFIQHHEIHPGQPIERVKETYLLPFYKVTIANWLVSIMTNEYDSKCMFLIPNSVDHKMFYASIRTKQSNPTIGFLFSENAFKGVIDSLQVIANLKIKIPNLRVIAFGTHAPETITLPDYIELTVSPAQDDIRLLYQQCDLWLCCSLNEGFGLTILEAMACRTHAVSTKCGGPEDIITEDVNGYLCEVNDIESLTAAANKILGFDNQEWLSFSEQAYKHATDYTWTDAAKLFEISLKSILAKSEES